MPWIDLLILVVAVAGAALAWRTRASRAATEGGPRSGPTAAAPAPRPAPRQRRESPLSRDATERSVNLCIEMVRSQFEFWLREPVTAETKDVYGVGDPESGAGDSLIAEGIAKTASGRTVDFHCSMAHLGGYGGSPVITRGVPR
ncbi:MAG TPA: hypothetical protein VHM30_09175 [Gemmatimonadaceae bacterium]|nr:hypothetical protein [Gemmatimonadaceae bacterium]